MENQLPTNDKNAENMTLQEYADLYCAGDRFRAIYELVNSNIPGSFDRHIADLSGEEASFVMWLVQDAAIKAYGGQSTFDRAVKANTLAETLGVNIYDIQPETKNPFAQKLILSIIGVFIAIAITVLIGVVDKHLDINIAYVGEVLIGLAAVSSANHIVPFLRFQKLKKQIASLPSLEVLQSKEYCPPRFEEVFALFRQLNTHQAVIEKEEAVRLLRASSRQIILTLLWMLGYIAMIMVCVILACFTGIIGSVVCSLFLIAFFIWQMVTMFRCLLKSKAVGSIKDVDEQQQKAMDTRQSLLALAAICVAGLYLLFTVGGCLASIMISLQV